MWDTGQSTKLRRAADLGLRMVQDSVEGEVDLEFFVEAEHEGAGVL